MSQPNNEAAGAAKEEVLTEVTSIAKEEERTGQEIDVPSSEELVARASSAVISNLQALKSLITAKDAGGGYLISRKGMNRLVEAIFDLPTEGNRVSLQGKTEKQAFFLGQNLMRSQFILIQNHIVEEMKKRKEAELAAKNNSEEKQEQEGVSNEQQTSI